MFDPRAGSKWDREEDHLAMMIELLGDFPRSFVNTGKNSDNYFDRNCELRNIHSLKYWPLKEVLRDKYRFSEEDAQGVSDFLVPMLQIDPDKRITAQEALGSPWICDI